MQWEQQRRRLSLGEWIAIIEAALIPAVAATSAAVGFWWQRADGPRLPPEQALLWELMTDRTLARVGQRLEEARDYVGEGMHSVRENGVYEYILLRQGGEKALPTEPTPHECAAFLCFFRSGQREVLKAWRTILEAKYGRAAVRKALGHLGDPAGALGGEEPREGADSAAKARDARR